MSETWPPPFKNPWATKDEIDLSTVFRSCLGYAETPAWAFIRRCLYNTFSRFDGLETIELGCGEGKVSLLFSLLGASTTLVDNNRAQLERARYVAAGFETHPVFMQQDLLQLPESLTERFDVSMSFGTAEHFFGRDRQRVFEVHRRLLKKGGLTILWVPNRYGLLFHFGVFLRKAFRRQTSLVPEMPFTRRELYQRAKVAQLTDLKVAGGEFLVNDFNHFILDLRRVLRLPTNRNTFKEPQKAKAELLRRMHSNKATISPWNNFFSYPLVLMGRRT